jgi:hypothetical protein
VEHSFPSQFHVDSAAAKEPPARSQSLESYDLAIGMKEPSASSNVSKHNELPDFWIDMLVSCLSVKVSSFPGTGQMKLVFVGGVGGDPPEVEEGGDPPKGGEGGATGDDVGVPGLSTDSQAPHS